MCPWPAPDDPLLPLGPKSRPSLPTSQLPFDPPEVQGRVSESSRHLVRTWHYFTRPYRAQINGNAQARHMFPIGTVAGAQELRGMPCETVVCIVEVQRAAGSGTQWIVFIPVGLKFSRIVRTYRLL